VVDLHTHTNESDGTDSPPELVERAWAQGVKALAITDHDTVSGYGMARRRAGELGLRLIQGVEISTKARGRSVHVLAYWFGSETPEAFLIWLRGMLEIRRERNRKLTARLRELGLAIELEEAESLGRTVTGRVHIARVLIAKGYVSSIAEAFDRYIGEEAPGYVTMEDPKTPLAIAKVREHGGVPVLAHPIRLGMREKEVEEGFVREQVEAGLLGLEVMHSDQNEEAQRRYLWLAERYGLAPSGGSDFHGAIKPQVELGRGVGGNVAVPGEWLDKLASI
jgi:predicted metal-dependent phosphoesterase TrpH